MEGSDQSLLRFTGRGESTCAPCIVMMTCGWRGSARAPDALGEADEVRQGERHGDVPAGAPAAELRHRVRRGGEHGPGDHRAHGALDVRDALGEAREEVREQEVREAHGLRRREHPPERREEEAPRAQVEGVDWEEEEQRGREVQEHGLRGGGGLAAGGDGGDERGAAGEDREEAEGGEVEGLRVGEVHAGVVGAEERLRWDRGRGDSVGPARLGSARREAGGAEEARERVGEHIVCGRARASGEGWSLRRAQTARLAPQRPRVKKSGTKGW